MNPEQFLPGKDDKQPEGEAGSDGAAAQPDPS
jgi:hypothetical protein